MTDRVLNVSWQRCRVHFMRNAMAHAGKTQRRIVSAWIGTAFAQDDADAASKQWRSVADQLRPRVPKLAALMDDAEADVLAFTTFPKEHRAKIHSTNPLERLNGEINLPRSTAPFRLCASSSQSHSTGRICRDAWSWRASCPRC